jgi:hypothetical protein
MLGQKRSPDSPTPIIPAQVVVGVTGHRDLNESPALSQGIHSAIEEIRRMSPSLRSTPLILSILSPLAEGADRLVAREVLKDTESVLEVVLPLEIEEYVKDFQTEESRKEFEGLLSQAKSVRILPSRGSRNQAYDQVGRHIVDQCDVLIALWDGKPASGQGGTAEIVQYARKHNCPLIWINTEAPEQITVEPGRGIDLRPFQDLDEYNSERVNTGEVEQQLKQQLDFFAVVAHRTQLPADTLRPTFNYILSNYVRADILALRFQHLYHRCETVVYILALLAIAVAASQFLFLQDQPIILVSEVLLMLAVLAIFAVGRHQRWHTKWIDYRFLAERFRSALFMASVNIDVATLRPPRHLSLSYSSNDWMVNAFSSFWNQRPPLQKSDSSLFDSLKDFLCQAWLEDQIRYHDSTSKRHYRRHHHLTRVSYILLGLTVLAAIIHIVDIGSHTLQNAFAFMAIVFPTAALFISAIRTHRDYLRNSMRSSEMVNHLTELKDRMTTAEDHDTFLRLVRETEETMLHENEDWRVVVRFNIPEVPA